MMTIEQRIMAGEDPAKIMQEIETAKEKKAAADERKRTAARKASEEQIKKARAEVTKAVMDYMKVLGVPQDALDEMVEAYTEETFKEIEFAVKMMIPMLNMASKAEKKPTTYAEADKIIAEFLKSL